MARKFWQLNRQSSSQAKMMSEEFGFDPLLVMLLNARGISEPEEIERFLDDTEDLSDPFLMKDMDKAVYYIKKALDENKKITIYGDYDCDGVTSTVILYTYLKKQGANVDYYIPSRLNEGYGMNTAAIEKIAQRGTQIIITVDNGITAFDQARRIKELGMELIVTDHHRIDGGLPDALACVDAHRDDDEGEEKNLSGVGVAYKLVMAMEDNNLENIDDYYLQLVCIGTIADAVPLVGENRILVRRGLEQIKKQPINGIYKLLEVSSSLSREIDSTAVAFYIAPRINAAGRMGSADSAVELLLSETDVDALSVAGELDTLNRQRQQIEKTIVDDAIAKIESDDKLKYSKVLVVDGKNWHEGIVGIAAARIMETYSKPTFIISEGENGVCKGSARSFGDFSLFDALQDCRESLMAFGGHALAAGVTLKKEKLDEFRKKINEYAERFDVFLPILNIDLRLNPHAVSLDLIESLSPMKPYGNSNNEPVFGLYDMTISKITPMGVDKNHLRLTFTRGETSVDAVFFRQTLSEFEFIVGDNVDVACTLSKNEFNNRVSVQIQVKNIKSHKANDNEYFHSMELYRKFLFGEKMTAEQINEIRPDRKTLVDVFNIIKTNSQRAKSAESIQLALTLPSSRVGCVQVCLDAFSQLNLIERTDFTYHVVPSKEKKDLTSAQILKALEYGG